MRLSSGGVAGLWLAGMLCVSHHAYAQDRELRYDLRIDVPVTGLAMVLPSA